MPEPKRTVERQMYYEMLEGGELEEVPSFSPQLAAARVTDLHECPDTNPDRSKHVGGPILPPCEPTVLVDGLAQARVTDKAKCEGPTATIVTGAASVIVGGQYATRVGENTSHGGVILPPCSPTTFIGGPSVGKDGVPPGYVEEIKVEEVPYEIVHERGYGPEGKHAITTFVFKVNKYAGAARKLYIMWDDFKKGYEHRGEVLNYIRNDYSTYGRLKTAPAGHGALLVEDGYNRTRFVGVGATPNEALESGAYSITINQQDKPRFYWATYHKRYE